MPFFKIKYYQKKIDKKDNTACKGFTIIELMLVIAIIGIIAAIAIPNYLAYRKKAHVANVASSLKNFQKGFIAYAIDEGEFPTDSHIVLPDLPTMAKYIRPEAWGQTTPLGGTYNWEGPDNYPYAGISIFESTAPQGDLELLDLMLDDGDLTQGKFRQTPNGRYTYIIEE